MPTQTNHKPPQHRRGTDGCELVSYSPWRVGSILLGIIGCAGGWRNTHYQFDLLQIIYKNYILLIKIEVLVVAIKPAK